MSSPYNRDDDYLPMLAARRAALDGLMHTSAWIAKPVDDDLVFQGYMYRIVLELSSRRTSTEDLKRLYEMLSSWLQRTAEPERVEAEIRETTSFAWVLDLLPPRARDNQINRIMLLVAVLSFILQVIQVVMGQTEPSQPLPAITQEQAEEIVDQLRRIAEELDDQGQPHPTPAPVAPPTPPAQ